jgi:hypothetical protein
LRVSFTNTFAGTCAITITRGAKPGGGRAFGPEFFSCQAGQPSRTIRPRLKARSYWLELVRGSRDASKPPKKDSELLKVSR